MKSALLALVPLLLLAGPARADTTYYYASPTGAGSGPCSFSAPCTLAHTQAVVRAAVAAGLTRPITVYLRGGTYTQTTGLVFSGADSVTAGSVYFAITPNAAGARDFVYPLSQAPEGFWQHVSSSGGDIRVFQQDGTTPVAREVREFNLGAHTGYLYISTNSSAATSFVVYCGSGAPEPAPTSAQGAYSTWSDQGAQGIYHLEEGVSSAQDSTQFQDTAVNTAATSATGKVGNGLAFYSGAATLNAGNAAALDFTGATPFTVSFWLAFAPNGAQLAIVGKGANISHTAKGWLVLVYGGNPYLMINAGTSAGANELLVSATSWPTYDGSYHLVTITYDGSKTAAGVTIYGDGAPKSKTVTFNTLTNSASTSADVVIAGQVGGGANFDGALDEIRVYSRALSAMEISALYSNQQSLLTFWETSALTVAAPAMGVTWKAYPGEAPAISGGRIVTGWSLYSGNIYRAAVTPGWTFRQLYVDGAHVQRARGPLNPTGWVRTDTGYTAPNSDIASYGNLTDVEIISIGNWSKDIGKISTAVGTAVGMNPVFWALQQALYAAYFVRETPSWIENAYELMTAGSFYLNKTTGYLYLWMADGSDPANATVTAPVAGPLFTVFGAHNMTFSGLTFEYSNWLTPDSDAGYMGHQSGYAVTAWNGSWPTSTMAAMDGAIDVTASNNISFTENKFEHPGSRAIFLNGGNSNVSITNNLFDDSAAGAIQIGDVGVSLWGSTPYIQETNITFSNNVIYGPQFDYTDSGAIFVASADGVTVAQNTVYFTSWSGISVGWGWDAATPVTPYASNVTVTGNYIYSYCTTHSDCGAIYSNSLHSVGGSYLTGLTAQGNYALISNIGQGCYYSDGGRWETFTGNVCRASYYWMLTSPGTDYLVATGNYLETTAIQRAIGTHMTITPNSTITTADPAYGTPQRAIINNSGVGCASPGAADQWPSYECDGLAGIQSVWPY